MSYLNGQWWLEGLAAVEIMTIVNSTLDYSLAYAELFIPIYTFFSFMFFTFEYGNGCRSLEFFLLNSRDWKLGLNE